MVIARQVGNARSAGRGRPVGPLLAPLGQAAGAYQATGAGASILAIFEDRRAGNESGAVPVDSLHEPPPTGWQVGHHLRLMQSQLIEVDQVDIGSETRCEAATIGTGSCHARCNPM